MTYQIHADIAHHGTIIDRVAACAAQEGYPSARRWAVDNILYLVKADWIAAWDSFQVANPGEDPGTNELVITDGMILASVQAAGSG